MVEPVPHRLGGDSTPLTQATIMMVDDEPTTMEVMQAFLEEAGYEHFVIVEDSTKAIDEIEEHRPDILLLDLVMPGMTGFQILGQVRSLPKLSQLPVIILTSSSDSETKLQALGEGATDFLAKPVDPSELILRVRNTLAAKAYQNQLAYYDALTKLPNRNLFLDRLAWFIGRAERQHEIIVVLHITLDGFRRVYQTFGPQVADHVTTQITERINACIRRSDVLGRGVQDEKELDSLFRLGGEEFSLLCPMMTHTEHATKLASRIIETMKIPFAAAGTEIHIKPNIGIASYPADARDMTTLLQCAVGASAQVKAKEHGGFEYYSSVLNARSVEQLQLEADLRHAIENDQLVLYYQPQVDVKNGQIKGVEALVRWRKPDGDFVYPDHFIPLAEETGLILPLGKWVLKEACAQWARWEAQGVKIHISVNLSAKQFHDNHLVQLVKDAFQLHSVDPQYLMLELTESLVIEQPEQAVATLTQLIELGVKLSIDDFGTGYSSLSYLKRFPLHELKIDRSFLKDMMNDPGDRALVSAMIYLAHEFNLKVVAEGVEEQGQLDILASLNCDEYQGYFFSRPVSASDLAPLLSPLLIGVEA